MPNIITDQDYLPPGYVLARRIDYEDYEEESFLNVIKEHCIEANQPLVVSNMNKSPKWNQRVFTLEQLKSCRGETGKHFFLHRLQPHSTHVLPSRSLICAKGSNRR